MTAEPHLPDGVVTLDISRSAWGRVFTIAPLVVVGTKEREGYDLAPKHMALPLGWDNYFGFVCTPRHGTYQNVRRTRAFTVSYPSSTQVVVASLAAAPRHGWEGEKPITLDLPTFPATRVDGVLLRDAYFFLECELHQVFDDFGVNSLITGRVVAAHADEAAMRLSDVEDEELIRRFPLLAYVDPGRYAALSETRTFPFPAGFTK